MKNRRGFLSLLSVAPSIGVAIAMAAEGTSPPADAAAPPAAPSHASPAALAVASSYRRFDARLDDDEIARIAKTIDDNRASFAGLNPKGKPLANGDEPATRFAIHESRPA
jgi:hypothetical protein